MLFFSFSSLLFFHFLIFVFVCDLNTMITRRGNKRVGGGSPFPLPQDPARPRVRCIVNVTEKVETDQTRRTQDGQTLLFRSHLRQKWKNRVLTFNDRPPGALGSPPAVRRVRVQDPRTESKILDSSHSSSPISSHYTSHPYVVVLPTSWATSSHQKLSSLTTFPSTFLNIIQLYTD